MTNEQQPYRDPIYDEKPEKAWLVITNICDKGKFKVTLEVNGKEKVLFHSYPDQSEGVISDHHNLTWLIKGSQTPPTPMVSDGVEKAKESCECGKTSVGYCAIHKHGWVNTPKSPPACEHGLKGYDCYDCYEPETPPDDKL